MIFTAVRIDNIGTPHRVFVYRDTFGVLHNFTTDEIKSMWAKNTFTGVKIDTAGRLIVDRGAFKGSPTTPSIVQSAQGNVTSAYRIITGDGLLSMAIAASNGKRQRYAVREILNKLKGHQAGIIYTVRGLRRTGKTTAVLQVINTLLNSGIAPNKIGYITVTLNNQKTDSSVTDEIIEILEKTEWEYAFVDEVTHLTGILQRLKVVSDVIAFKKRVVLTGTDSYVWPVAARDVLYGRSATIDLTYMSFKEYCEVFPERVKGLGKTEAVKQFCFFSGVLNETEYGGISNAFISLQTAIVDNIVNTIFRNKDHPTIREHTGELYKATKAQITEAVICAVISSCRTQNVAAFKTSGVKVSDLAAVILDKTVAFKASGISQKVLTRLTAALVELNVLDRIENFAKPSELVIPEGKAELTCHISSLYNTIIRSIGQEAAFIGDALENLVLSQCVQFARTKQKEYIEALSLESIEVGFCRYKVSESFIDGVKETNRTPEVDVVIRRRNYDGVFYCCAIEVKKAERGSENAQIENLCLPSMEEALGRIDRRIVVYTGESKEVDGVVYVHVYDFLFNIENWVM